MPTRIPTDSGLTRNRCKWIERDEQGRPRCEHGWAVSQGRGKWDCREKKHRRDSRYRSTEKGRTADTHHKRATETPTGSYALVRPRTERDARYNRSQKGRERYRRYEETRIRVRIAGVIDTTYRIPAGAKERLVNMIVDYRERRADEYRAESLAMSLAMNEEATRLFRAGHTVHSLKQGS